MKNYSCWHAYWDQSFLLATSSCLWVLHTQENTFKQQHFHTHLQLSQTLRSTITKKLTRPMHAFTRHSQEHSLISPPRASSLPFVYAMTAVDDLEMENNLQLLTRPDDTQTHAHARSLVFIVVVSSGHSPMKITWWTSSSSKEKNPSENLDHKNVNKHFFSIYVKKKTTQQIHRGSFKGILILAVL